MRLTCILELFGTLAIVATAIIVMVGILSPGEALKRLAAALLLLLVLPAAITNIVQSIVLPFFASILNAIRSRLYVAPVVAFVAFIGWLAIKRLCHCSKNRKDNGE